MSNAASASHMLVEVPWRATLWGHGGAIAVDAVMSMMGTGLGDAVVEFVYRVVLAHAGHIGVD